MISMQKSYSNKKISNGNDFKLMKISQIATLEHDFYEFGLSWVLMGD